MISITHEVIETAYSIAMNCNHLDDPDNTCGECTTKMWKAAEAAEARADTFSETIETLVNEKAQAEIELNVWKARALSAEALWHGAEAERDNERRMVESLSRECNDLTRQLEKAQERIDSYDKADRALNQALNEGDGVYLYAMSELEQSQSNNYTQKYPATQQRTCPVCGDRVVCNLRAGQWMLDYHHDKRAGYKKWCGGSDMNLSEAAQ